MGMTLIRPDEYDAMVTANLADASRHHDALAEDPERWYRALCGIQQNIQAQFTDHRARAVEAKTRCLANGAAGKRAWFLYEAEDQRWRGRAQHKLRRVIERLREAKDLRLARYAAEHPQGPRRVDRLALLAHREHLEALVLDDTAWTAHLVSKATRVRLRGLLDDLDHLLHQESA